MNAPSVPDQVKTTQRRASDPTASSWVRANAGAGKTYVLAQRVLRLLLAGCDPARILCITYTKAAAAEMANRVFDWLGEWATMPERDLRQALEELQGRPASNEELARARRLFAAAVETPGRLRVQTIHAFCERLLQQFPFEASVTAGFSVIEERDAAELLAEARSRVLRDAAQPDSPLGPALERMAAEAGDAMLADLFGAVVKQRSAFLAWQRAHHDLDGALNALAAELGLEPGEDEGTVIREILDGPNLPRSEWPGVTDWLNGGSVTDCKQAAKFLSALTVGDDEAVRICRSIYFTDKGEPRKNIATVGLGKKNPELAERLAYERDRIIPLCEKLNAAQILDSSSALFRLAAAVIGRYERLKGARGFLDYDDLIERTAQLLTRADAAWVLYKLDGGLDHLLIDEAQDTSPLQWQVIAAVVEEFFAGRSARETARTIFAVGDEKQSIYSFQGADPAGFDDRRRKFASRAEGAGQALHDLRLTLSFRSTPAVLDTVDRVFADPAAARGLHSGEATAVVHQAVRTQAAGRVEIWEVEAPDGREPAPPWDAPFDVEREDSAEVRVAERIAKTIRRWIDRDERLEATGKPIRPGDVMILVRNRQPLAGPMIRALKAHNIPVAGADRLVLTDHIAVMDLMALGRFCLLPEDDLTLAALLKSPLIGLSEEELMEIAVSRSGSLFQSLAAGAKDGNNYAKALARLSEWRKRAGFERPYEFYAGVLGADGMRKAFHGRLGAEAFEAIDEFLSLALAFERGDTPALAGFLNWLDAAPSEVKRDMDKGRDEVRVMTVHGAKGLEAPIVFLPDTCRDPSSVRVGPIFRFEEAADGGPLVWAPRKSDDCEATRRLREAAVARRCQEDNRLLYVGMTRARDRLYVAGFEGKRGRNGGCWYELVRKTMEPHLEKVEEDGLVCWRMKSDLPPAPAAAPQSAGRPRDELPGWIGTMVRPDRVERRLAPSHLVEHAPAPVALPDPVSRRKALHRGRVIHRLLESLPEMAPEHRGEAGRRALATLAPRWSEDERAAALAEVQAVLSESAFAEAFLPGSRAEIAIAGQIAGLNAPVTGQLDRLAVSDAAVFIVDYKTDRIVPREAGGIPPAYLAQIAAYRALVAQLHPERAIRAAILWTAAPRLMEIPGALLDAHAPAASP